MRSVCYINDRVGSIFSANALVIDFLDQSPWKSISSVMGAIGTSYRFRLAARVRRLPQEDDGVLPIALMWCFPIVIEVDKLVVSPTGFD